MMIFHLRDFQASFSVPSGYTGYPNAIECAIRCFEHIPEKSRTKSRITEWMICIFKRLVYDLYTSFIEMFGRKTLECKQTFDAIILDRDLI